MFAHGLWCCIWSEQLFNSVDGTCAFMVVVNSKCHPHLGPDSSGADIEAAGKHNVQSRSSDQCHISQCAVELAVLGFISGVPQRRVQREHVELGW